MIKKDRLSHYSMQNLDSSIANWYGEYLVQKDRGISPEDMRFSRQDKRQTNIFNFINSVV